MTRIWQMADLHQEFVTDRQYGNHPATRFEPMDDPPDDFDVVVIAGDIDVPLTRSLQWVHDRFAGIPTIVVPGNHDFFAADDLPPYTMVEQIDAGRELADKLGIHLLMDDVVELDGTRFLGGTLWTDMASVGLGSTLHKMRQSAGRDGMNDYKAIKRFSTATPGKRKRLRPEDTIAAHRATRTFLKNELEKPFEGPTVVVTHHAPHPNSLNHRDGGRLPWCYASHLGLLFEGENAPDIWMHGHIHGRADYTVGDGKTRVLMNSRGYQFDDDAGNGFDPKFVVEVPVPAQVMKP